MKEWLIAFTFGQAVEVPIYLLAFLGAARPLWQKAAIGFGATALTHPVVWFVFPRLIDDYVSMAVAAETFAVAVEAVYLAAFGVRRALIWSVVSNGASLGLGLFSRAWLGWP